MNSIYRAVSMGCIMAIAPCASFAGIATVNDVEHETLAGAVAAAPDNGKVMLHGNVALATTLNIDKQLTIVGAGFTISAKNLGGPAIAAQNASLRLQNLTIETDGDGIIFAGGSDAAFSFSGDSYVLALQSCTITNTSGNAGTGVAVSGLDERNILVGATSIASFERGLVVDDSVTGALVKLYGGLDAVKPVISAKMPLSCDGRDITLDFDNIALVAAAPNSAALWFGENAVSNSVAFSGTQSSITLANGADGSAYLSLKDASALSSCVVGVKCVLADYNLGTEPMCEIREPASWRDYLAVQDTFADAGNISAAPSVPIVRQFAAAKGTRLYATKEDAIAEITAEDMALALAFGEDGRPVVRLVRDADRYGVTIGIVYSGDIEADVSEWPAWSEDAVADSVPDTLFFTTVIDKD